MTMGKSACCTLIVKAKSEYAHVVRQSRAVDVCVGESAVAGWYFGKIPMFSKQLDYFWTYLVVVAVVLGMRPVLDKTHAGHWNCI